MLGGSLASPWALCDVYVLWEPLGYAEKIIADVISGHARCQNQISAGSIAKSSERCDVKSCNEKSTAREFLTKEKGCSNPEQKLSSSLPAKVHAWA